MILDYFEKIAANNYDTKTFDHVMRVANYSIGETLFALANDLGLHIETLYQAALMHDILEDTDFNPQREFNPEVWDIVDILTKPKNRTYEEYLVNIKKRMKISEAGKYAYIIKLADMKDHLSQKDTLTDRLKEKYLNGLAILL